MSTPDRAQRTRTTASGFSRLAGGKRVKGDPIRSDHLPRSTGGDRKPAGRHIATAGHQTNPKHQIYCSHGRKLVCDDRKNAIVSGPLEPFRYVGSPSRDKNLHRAGGVLRSGPHTLNRYGRHTYSGYLYKEGYRDRGRYRYPDRSARIESSLRDQAARNRAMRSSMSARGRPKRLRLISIRRRASGRRGRGVS